LFPERLLSVVNTNGGSQEPIAKKPGVVRGLRLPQGLLSRFEVLVLVAQKRLFN
jgi:hypothetical protein